MSTIQRLPAALLALMLMPVAISASASEPAQTAQQATISLVGDGPYYRLTLPTARAFPEKCCYLIRLEASKRTLESCTQYVRNASEMTLGIGV